MENLTTAERHMLLHDRMKLCRAPIAPGMLPGHEVNMSGVALVCKTNWAREAMARDVSMGNMLLRVMVLSMGAPNAVTGVVRTNLAKPTGAWGERY